MFSTHTVFTEQDQSRFNLGHSDIKLHQVNKQHNLEDEATGERCFYGIFTIRLIFKEKIVKKTKFTWTIHFPALVAQRQRGPIFNLRSGRHSSPR